MKRGDTLWLADRWGVLRVMVEQETGGVVTVRDGNQTYCVMAFDLYRDRDAAMRSWGARMREEAAYLRRRLSHIERLLRENFHESE